ncbi:DUF6507 family protein [Zhihengliuella salsuginis]|uniref:Uncharacterized protein n=1 Tax=Zhihengliuella salsuginis TaxID=578222 RepID=A0ABQ3G9Z6_9MICC|nr:DUF6507 family protein [Zhihengliuella salsuginis]GHC99254.1 hypothetical protein GCM10008096_01210 [Zhihengliuella salsuginis]
MSWELNQSAAQGAVDGTRTSWSDLDGHENKIQTAMSNCAEAAVEERIFNALNKLYDNAVNPLTVTMIKSGRAAADSAQAVINELKNANEEMTGESQRVVADAIQDSGKLPDYNPGEGTSTTPTVGPQKSGEYQV